MGHKRQLSVIAVVSMLATLAAAQNSRPELQTIVDRMVAAQLAQHQQFRPYVVTREYQLFKGDDRNPDSEVVASVSYFPPDTKQFSITNTAGSGRGERVVRKVLEHESKMAGNWRDSAITADNYKFSFVGEEILNGRRCFVLGLAPLRDSKELIEGRAWVDAESFHVRQIAGEPSKSPSWWIKKLNVKLSFAEVEGMWLQTATHADADVRFFGRHELDSRDINYKTGAEAARMQKLQRREPQDLLGVAIVR